MQPEQQQHLYSSKVMSLTVTLFAGPPSRGGPDPAGCDRLADELARRILNTITQFSADQPSILVALT